MLSCSVFIGISQLFLYSEPNTPGYGVLFRGIACGRRGSINSVDAIQRLGQRYSFRVESGIKTANIRRASGTRSQLHETAKMSPWMKDT